MQGKGLMLEAVAEIREYRAGRAVAKWIVPSGRAKLAKKVAVKLVDKTVGLWVGQRAVILAYCWLHCWFLTWLLRGLTDGNICRLQRWL